MKLATFSPLPSGTPRPGLVVADHRIVDIPATLGAERVAAAASIESFVRITLSSFHSY